ncbi:thiamine phosphate synthase [Modicisalibacter coralii]|uniref:thiamine phosphate synthase n=1 Tax=Modicisalibacter coralii TaxID=2304602 RepID=UPI00100B965B|nr:thiamine phosphate synthase [Halomonas coralii]
MTRAWRSGVYAITDADLLPDDARLVAACDAALRGGLALLQYRDKSRDAPRRRHQAEALATLCRQHGVPLIVNDDLDLARELREAGFANVGVHLGQEDTPVAVARRQLGDAAIVGATCHARLDLAERAAGEGASYLAFGRFFTSRTKPEAPPADLGLLAEAARFDLPRVAIGGLGADNVGRAREAGADLVAMVHAVFGDGDPAVNVRRLRRRLS